MRRRPSDDDQRVVFGELTPAGRKVLGSLFPAHVEFLHQATAGLSLQEKRAAGQLMQHGGGSGVAFAWETQLLGVAAA